MMRGLGMYACRTPLGHTSSLNSRSGQNEIKAVKAAFGTPYQRRDGNMGMFLPIILPNGEKMDITDFVTQWSMTPMHESMSEADFAAMGLNPKEVHADSGQRMITVAPPLARAWTKKRYFNYPELIGNLGEYMATTEPFMNDPNVLYYAWDKLRQAGLQRKTDYETADEGNYRDSL